jgi:hypothetical protein
VIEKKTGGPGAGAGRDLQGAQGVAPRLLLLQQQLLLQLLLLRWMRRVRVCEVAATTARGP